MARPSIYSSEIAAEICEWIACGKSLTSFCSQDGKPGYSTIMSWLLTNDEFQANYSRARDWQGENVADQIADIRSKVASGELSPEQGRVMISSLQWEAGKRCAKRYGDKLDVAVSGDVSFGERLAAARAAKPAGDTE